MKIQLICQNSKCNKQFERSIGEYRYNQKKGRRAYCSLSCAKKCNPTGPKISNTSGLKANNRADIHTGFREFITRIKRRAKLNSKFECQVTLEDLKIQFELQKGICPYSGIKLILPNNDIKIAKTHMASLDRKDSSKGYIRGNIQFVSACINFMKSDLTIDEFEIFLKLVVHFNFVKSLT